MCHRLAGIGRILSWVHCITRTELGTDDEPSNWTEQTNEFRRYRDCLRLPSINRKIITSSTAKFAYKRIHARNPSDKCGVQTAVHLLIAVVTFLPTSPI